MNFNKTIYALAMSSVGVMGALSSVSSHAAVVANGDMLSINPGVVILNTAGKQKNVNVSWFAMDTDANGFTGTEKVALQQGTTGIIIGQTTSPGASHGGAIAPGDTNAITAPWNFFGNTGSDFAVTGITGDTTSGLDFSGWRVTWNGIPSINMGGGTQICGTTSDGLCVNNSGTDIGGTYNNGTGIAAFAWDGVYGHSYTLDYDATVPQADPSNFGGVNYRLHLEGVVNAAPVPEASTYGMMLAGLGLVGFMASRRRKSI
jgi:hypothetical protein